jgi:hypothetical protein
VNLAVRSRGDIVHVRQFKELNEIKLAVKGRESTRIEGCGVEVGVKVG